MAMFLVMIISCVIFVSSSPVAKRQADSIFLNSVDPGFANPCQQSNCFSDPCYGKVCKSNHMAYCVPNYCGGCNAIWMLADGKLVHDCEK